MIMKNLQDIVIRESHSKEKEHHHKDESVSSHDESAQKQISFEKLETVLTRNNLLILCCFDTQDSVAFMKVVNINGRCFPFFISIGNELRLNNSEKYELFIYPEERNQKEKISYFKITIMEMSLLILENKLRDFKLPLIVIFLS